MGKKSFDIYTCDRCKRSEEIRQSHQVYQWAKIYAKAHNGPSVYILNSGATGEGEQMDMCPDCARDLQTWWRDGASRDEKEKA